MRWRRNQATAGGIGLNAAGSVTKIDHPLLHRLRDRERRARAPAESAARPHTAARARCARRAQRVVEPPQSAAPRCARHHLQDRHAVGPRLQQLIRRNESLPPWLAAAPRQLVDSAASSSVGGLLGRSDHPFHRRPPRRSAPLRAPLDSSHCSTSTFQSAATAVSSAGPSGMRPCGGLPSTTRRRGSAPRLARILATSRSAIRRLTCKSRTLRSARTLESLRIACIGAPAVQAELEAMDLALDRPLESAAAARSERMRQFRTAVAQRMQLPEASRTSKARSTPVSTVKKSPARGICDSCPAICQAL